MSDEQAASFVECYVLIKNFHIS